jgi:hypothetical protein
VLSENHRWRGRAGVRRSSLSEFLYRAVGTALCALVAKEAHKCRFALAVIPRRLDVFSEARNIALDGALPEVWVVVLDAKHIVHIRSGRVAYSMQLLGHLTNPPSSLQAIFKALPDEPIEASVRPDPQVTTGRLGNGVVQRAVVKVLAAANGPMRRADVHVAVERLLGCPVSMESVSWSLLAGVRMKQPRFERVAYGCYRLAR